jgi:carbon monoxide dehydrogenase subunit G
VKLEKQFEVGVPLDRAWTQLSDMDGLARCLPGADLRRSPNGEIYTGEVTFGSNGSAAQLLGTLRPIDVDEDAHSASVRLQGRLLSAPALGDGILRARLEPAGDGTRVTLAADVRVTGATGTHAGVESGGRAALDGFAAGLERHLQETPAPVRAPAPERTAAPTSTPSPPEPAVTGSPLAGFGAGALALVAAGTALAVRRGRKRARLSIEYRW